MALVAASNPLASLSPAIFWATLAAGRAQECPFLGGLRRLQVVVNRGLGDIKDPPDGPVVDPGGRQLDHFLDLRRLQFSHGVVLADFGCPTASSLAMQEVYHVCPCWTSGKVGMWGGG